jgi:hypothetical protein
MNQVTVKRRAFFARTGNLLSTENPTFSVRMMAAVVSKRGFRLRCDYGDSALKLRVEFYALSP